MACVLPGPSYVVAIHGVLPAHERAHLLALAAGAVTGALMLTLRCAGLAKAPSDSENMVESAQRASAPHTPVPLTHRRQETTRSGPTAAATTMGSKSAEDSASSSSASSAMTGHVTGALLKSSPAVRAPTSCVPFVVLLAGRDRRPAAVTPAAV